MSLWDSFISLNSCQPPDDVLASTKYSPSLMVLLNVALNPFSFFRIRASPICIWLSLVIFPICFFLRSECVLVCEVADCCFCPDFFSLVFVCVDVFSFVEEFFDYVFCFDFLFFEYAEVFEFFGSVLVVDCDAVCLVYFVGVFFFGYWFFCFETALGDYVIPCFYGEFLVEECFVVFLEAFSYELDL